MQNQLWFDRLRKQLVARRLPRAYIDRIVEEMTDHFHDLTEESMKSEEESLAQLGEPEQVAKQASREYRRRTFLGRHPVIAFFTFAISPFFLLAAFTIGELLLLFWLSNTGDAGLFPRDTRFSQLTEFALQLAISFGFLIFPTVIVILLYHNFARKTRAPRLWIVVSCVGILFINYSTYFQVWFSRKWHHESAAVYLSWRGWPGLDQVVQCAIPIALCCWLLYKQRRTRAGEIEAQQIDGGEYARRAVA